MKAHKIAVITSNDIGKEVMPEGLRCIDAAARKHGIAIASEAHSVREDLHQVFLLYTLLMIIHMPD